ncbi:hypothetical protein [Duncaniella muris]|uniref:hypothetical protein n=1 Tax=Duncaniella muris TaxID=2094150 RepID=UPI0026747AFD|nr:hypothetical protein [Duncaniella muris]
MKVVLLSPGAKVPKRVNDYAAGYDLFAPKDSVVKPGRNLIPIDISIELDPHTEGEVRPCSGYSINGMKGFSLNDLKTEKRFDADVIIGTVDEDYRGMVGAIIKSYEDKPFVIKQGAKIAQLVVKNYIGKPFEIASELSKTERGSKGFGELEHK